MTVRLFATIILAFFSLHATSASALTMEQFLKICDSASGECSDYPILQAYIGGALDLLATLNEEKGYLGELYCEESKEVFDVPAISASCRNRVNSTPRAMPCCYWFVT